MNEQTLAIRIEAGNQTTLDHFAIEERALEWHPDKVTPRLVNGIAHADDRSAAFAIKYRRAADDKVSVRLPRQNIARIRGLEGDPARFEIDPIHIEGLAIAQVKGDENELRMPQIKEDILRAHAAEEGSGPGQFDPLGQWKRDDRSRRRHCPGDRGDASNRPPRHTKRRAGDSHLKPAADSSRQSNRPKCFGRRSYPARARQCDRLRATTAGASARRSRKGFLSELAVVIPP